MHKRVSMDEYKFSFSKKKLQFFLKNLYCHNIFFFHYNIMKEIKGKTFTEASANITRNLDSSKTYLVQLKNKSTNRSKKYILQGGLELDGNTKLPSSNIKITNENLKNMREYYSKLNMMSQIQLEKLEQIFRGELSKNNLKFYKQRYRSFFNNKNNLIIPEELKLAILKLKKSQ